MGYNTSYRLRVKSGNSDLLQTFIEGNEDAKFALDIYGDTRESIKWYSHENDLKEFTKENKELLLELYGEGEDNTDIWKKYFLNGRCQVCKARIVIDEFDYKKLI